MNEKKVAYRLEEIDPYEPPPPGAASGNRWTKTSLSLAAKAAKYPAWVAASPRGLVPALRTRSGHTVCDSMVCLEFIDEDDEEEEGGKEGGEEGCTAPQALLPRGNAALRARVRYWNVFSNEKIIPFFYKMLMSQDQHERDRATESIIANLTEFAAAMADEASLGPYFLGDVYSSADIVLFPWYERLLTVSATYRGFAPPDTPAFARLNTWHRAVRARPAVARTLADPDRLIRSYSGYADASATSDVAVRLGGEK